MSGLKNILKARWISSLLFLIALFAVTGMIDHSFFTYSSIVSCFNSSVVTSMLAIGIAFVIMTGEIDVSIGSTLGLTAAITGLVAMNGGSPATMVAVAILCGLVIGLVNGIGVAIIGVPSLIFTLGTCGIVRGLVYIVSDGRTVENFGGVITTYGNKVLFAQIQVYYAIVIALIVISHLALTKTRKGRYFIAVGDNPGGATLVGISVVKTKMLAYMLSGMFAGVAGVAFASKYGQVMITAGSGYEMTAIAACVLGGISLSGGLGNMIGAAFGSVIMASIARILVFIGLPSTYDNTITGIMLIAIVVIDALAQRSAVENARRKRLLSKTAEGGNKE